MHTDIRPVVISALSVLLLATSCSKSEQPISDEPPEGGDAIARVSNGLLPAVVEQGNRGKNASIPDRMSHYGVPGLSIAVIDDGDGEQHGLILAPRGTASLAFTSCASAV